MTAAEVLERIEHATGHTPRRNGSGWQAHCPAHEDRQASLSVSEGDKGVMLHCHAGCSTQDVCAALGLTMRDLFFDHTPREPKAEIVKTYGYVDKDGRLLYQVCRMVPKSFRQRRPDPERPDAWLWKLDGVTRVLYRLPDVLETVALDRPVYVVEGEKDAESLVQLGLCATTAAQGAGKWRDEYTQSLRDARVYILPDNDEPGRKHAEQVATALQGVAREVKIVELPGLPAKGDVSDWLAQGHTRDELQRLVDASPRWTPKREKEIVATAHSEPAKADDLTELATARRLRERYGEDMRHASGFGWLCWNGVRWEPSQKAAERFAHNMGRVIRDELAALKTKDPDLARAYYAHAKAVERDAGIQATLNIAKALEGIDADHVEWDSNPWLLNCPNGTIDLRTGAIRPHDRADCITKLSPTPYDPAAKAPRWLQFLSEVFCDDAALGDYWQWALGYALTGSVEHDCFFVMHGAGCNGKTTMLSTFQHVLGGDYAQQIDTEELMQQKFSRNTSALAALRGARFVVAMETPENRRINETLVKALTGGDRIRARFLYQNDFEFAPELKLFIGTNHRPTIRDDSNGMWRRVRLIPFEATFDGAQRDPNLQATLQDEGPGILAWAVEGARRVCSGEPDLPERVRAATDAYKAEQDTLGQFIEEECDLWECATVGKSELYRAFQAYNNGRCESRKAFTARLRARGFKESRLHGGQECWCGITLRQRDLEKYGEVG